MKSKKLIALIVSVMLTASFCTLTACKRGLASGGDSKRLDFTYCGSLDVLGMFGKMINTYNDTQGKEDKVTVKGIPVSESGIDSKLINTLPSSKGPDVVVVTDHFFKKHAVNLYDMTGKISSNIINDLYAGQESRYHYNVNQNTSNPEDPLLGLPVYNDSTVLYYNKTALEAAGVKVISVDEEDIEAFNNGAADLRGKTKADYGLQDVTVPAKGFYRSINNYVFNGTDRSGSSWKLPTSSEVLIFNDRIACNWDEIEDVGLILTKSRNSKSTTDFGFYTEWWFNYGWSVGGDCAVDLSGKGDWVYSLPSTVKNYIVNNGKTYTGVYTGKTYSAGETIDIKDILDAPKGATITCETEGDTTYYYKVNGARAAERAEMAAKVSDGVLTELPSIQDAFSRFCFLAGVGGLNVCPYPSAFNSTTSTSYFTSSKLAFLIERISNFNQIKSDAGFEWGIAKLPVYKTYTEPMDPDCDTVSARGKEANHSTGFSISIRKGTQLADESLKFVSWMVTEGQKYLAENGFASARKSDVPTMTTAMVKNYGDANTSILVDLLESSRAGDWWYMPNKSWIDIWANPLNSTVRYGRMSFDKFIYSYTTETNNSLAAFRKS